ncbi:MAG: NAD(P)/FAD-dependent oxidoreductase [Ramlibacter sp.]
MQSAPESKPLTPRTCDVLVIGGGPGGSTAAALLATRGLRVALLEKARHPRFHIGESLLPANLPLFDQLGVADKVKAISMQKFGAEFVSPWHEEPSATIHFDEAWNKDMPYSYQVRRSEFDEILLRNAQAKGAEVIEGCKVRDVAFRPDGSGGVIDAVHDDGRSEQWDARFVVDASGRDTLLGRKFDLKQRNPKHNSSAIYGHFKNAKRHAGIDEGNITIFWFDHGWFWFIPLADGCTSIGAVIWSYYLKTRDVPVEQFFLDSIAMCPALAERMEGATLVSEVEATGNFSYSCTRTHGPGYLLIGDAFTFIDPVFSSGVMLAMQGGFVAADTVQVLLEEPARAPEALRRFDRVIRQGPSDFSWFIYRVTNPIMRDMLMKPGNIFRVKEALISMLAGDIYGKTPIWGSIRILKGIYYMLSLANLKRSREAMRQRRFNIKSDGLDALAGRP